ncbi:MAG: hypothetical protein C6I00_03850 [Nitratiruptor sp.]|nr:hypothetical protein [Nitratiruptor sp.]NPA83916.1 hypothetical protein [Campylobacterota bacterium]
MIKLLIPLVLLAAATLYKIYRDYQGDRRKAILDILLLFFLLFATGFSSYLRIYTPLLFFHLLLLLIGWINYYRYLFGGRPRLSLTLAPSLTILLFFLAGLTIPDQ